MAKEQTARDKTASGGGDGSAPRPRPTFFVRFTALFAAAGALVLAAGLVASGFIADRVGALEGEEGTVRGVLLTALAVSMAALYVLLLPVVRRASNALHGRQAEADRQLKELKNSYESIVAVLCAALDLQDNVTQGHAQRVSEIASVVAHQMGLRKEQLRQIEKAAILHDIGKIGVADAVLSKPGPLTEAEWEEMKRHPELGFHILNSIDFLKDAAELVYCHHERYDGTGYPRGLKNDAIPVGARIFAVVDAYHAMTSHRPYRKALPHRKAVDEILRNAGSQFDPEVVRAFMDAERRGLLQNGRGDSGRDEDASDQRERTFSAAGE